MTPEQGLEQRQLAARGALLLALLRREKSGHLRRIFGWGGLRILAGLGMGAAALLALGSLPAGLPRVLGVLVGAGAWAGCGWLVWRHWVRPLRAVPNLSVFARLVEERHDFRDLLRAALEFSQKGVPAGQSSDLVSETVERAYQEASGLHLTQFFVFANRRRDALIAAGTAAAAVVLCLLAPQAPGRVGRGLMLQWPTPGDVLYGPLEVLSGDRTILAGEDVEVVARESGPQAPEVAVRYNDTGDLWKSRVLAPAGGGERREYSFKFEDVRSNLVYRFESGRRKTAEHRITVVQRPIVSALRVTLVPPAYTGRKPVELEEGRGDGVALRGSRVRIAAQSSSPLVSAVLVPEPGDAGAAATLDGPLTMAAERTAFHSEFALRGDLRYHFELVDSLGHTNADPVTYQLSVVEDRDPYVELRQPGQDADLPVNLQVPMSVYAADDFGVAKMTLFYKPEKGREEGVPADESLPDEPGVVRGGTASGGSGGGESGRGGEDAGWARKALDLHGDGATSPEGGPLSAGAPPEVLKNFTWSLTDAGLFPGDAMMYFVEVEDNDAVSGHKKARTQTYRLRLRTLSDLYAKVHENDEKRLNQLDDAIEKSKQLKEKYEKLARELKKTPDVDWKKEKEIQSALEKQKQLAEQVQKIAEDLEKSASKLQDQQLASQEITQKMNEIKQLLDQVQDKTMERYMQQLSEAMKQISPEEIQRAMEQMNMSQEEFLKRLERTKALLEQLQREQKLDSMIERVADLLRNQEKVSEKTQQLDEKGRQESKDGKDQDAKSQDPKDGQNKDGRNKDGQKKDGENKDGQKKDGDNKDGRPKDSPPQDAAPQEAKSAEQLAQEQKELAQKMEELEKELAALNEESKQAGQEQLEDAQQEMQQQDPSGEMDEASQNLQQQQSQQAQPHQQKAQKSLRTLYKQLMQAQQQMSMQQDAEMAAALQKAARQALDVSFRQEGVTKESTSEARQSEQGDLAEQQQALVAATGKIVNDLDTVAKQSSSAPAQVNAMLGEAMSRMKDGVKSYEKGDPMSGRAQGEEAYGILNKVVVELNRSASSSCSKPGSGQSSQQKMQDLMGRQQQLNDMTRQLQQQIPNPQNLSPEQRAQMGRLLGEQQAIQQQLQDIERQAREQRELLGRMDKLQDEMHEVVQDMQSEQLGEETLRVQERIVSRMLDAQRSLHKRDFSEERQSRTGEEIYSQGGKMPAEADKLKKLRRDIDRALREGTPEEYEDLVREYFRAISEAPTAPPGPVP